MSAIILNFTLMRDRDKLMALLCPATTAVTKTVSKFVGKTSHNNKNLENGSTSDAIIVYGKHYY